MEQWFERNYIGSEGAILQAKDIWSNFKTPNQNLGKLEKRSKNKKALIGVLKEKPGWKDKYQPRIDGKQICMRGVLFGYKQR